MADLKLETTTPDFELAWIDEPLRIHLKDALVTKQSLSDEAIDNEDDDTDDEPQELKNEQEIGFQQHQSPIVATSEGVVETTLGEARDPTFRIGSLPAAHKTVITVNQDNDLIKAITTMTLFNYSQLPIMQGEREVKGMISWKSIAARVATGNDCPKVQQCREDAQVIDSNGTLFDAIPTIVKHGYVLVRDLKDRKITGIVTTSDLISQFQSLTEPFLLLREIELHLRRILDGKIDFEVVENLFAFPKKSINDLNFGDYVRLLERPEVWSKLLLNVDQNALTSQLEKVRLIRNDVMHSDPDPVEERRLETLKNAANFMRQLYELNPPLESWTAMETA